MEKDTTRTGQQYSASTPYKLKGFRYLMSYHARVCEKILNKRRQPYLYIDLNCGAGYQPDYRKYGDEVLGSPIIALQELNSRGIEPICHFCDSNEESLEILKATIERLGLACQPRYWSGNNRDSLPSICQDFIYPESLGLVYSDPNGKQDFPLLEIKNSFSLEKLRKVDLLMNVATNYVRRWESNPKVNWNVYPLEDLLSEHGKSHVFVRYPENLSLKWTFVYATNFEKQKELKKIHLYRIEGDIGKNILDHLFSPKSNPLPLLNEDGSIGIQQKLDFDFRSDKPETND
ncbi:three-Cys-motif partner protein TcmP [Nodosilinea sp. PGN35]|uniref:three-Cys-motif partner protein TcmP n=1 Tax=Nodosilinea sp. PGN35 TaxID=3020489 RepID=UPI0023B2FED3|nr:three-Cys-motif partner protein TcmP [Nodosilinea sp. TSF1-S3]MDF0369433.1 three-Cys-motif partner protein TcmP [Nodosilinea sp. TSF1-S3]